MCPTAIRGIIYGRRLLPPRIEATGDKQSIIHQLRYLGYSPGRGLS
jgi:hypothetical protein